MYKYSIVPTYRKNKRKGVTKWVFKSFRIECRQLGLTYMFCSNRKEALTLAVKLIWAAITVKLHKTKVRNDNERFRDW